MPTPSLVEGLDLLESWRTAHDPIWEHDLKPGLEGQAIERLAKSLRPYKLPRELYELYGWRDGQSGDSDFFDLGFSSLEQAVHWYHFLLRAAEGWNPLWFPFCDCNNDQYLVELADPRRELAESSAIYLAQHQNPDMYLWCQSLSGLVDATLLGLEQGGYVLKKEAYWDCDHDKAVRWPRDHRHTATREMGRTVSCPRAARQQKWLVWPLLAHLANLPGLAWTVQRLSGTTLGR